MGWDVTGKVLNNVHELTKDLRRNICHCERYKINHAVRKEMFDTFTQPSILQDAYRLCAGVENKDKECC